MTEEQNHFSELFAASEASLSGFVFSLVPHRADADDILQETLRCLWEHYEEYDSSRPFLPWAYQFAYRQVLIYRRSKAIRSKYFSEAVVESLAVARPTDDHWQAEQQRALRHCLSRLTPRERELVRERYASDKSIADLSAEAGQSANSYYKRLQRIRLRLVACIEYRRSEAGGT